MDDRNQLDKDLKLCARKQALSPLDPTVTAKNPNKTG
jgi:hypothetical protein